MVVKYRSYGWAKREIEYRNRFQPKSRRQEVTQSAWDMLFGHDHLNLTSSELTSVDAYYQRYKNHFDGFNLDLNQDGRDPR